MLVQRKPRRPPRRAPALVLGSALLSLPTLTSGVHDVELLAGSDWREPRNGGQRRGVWAGLGRAGRGE